MINKMTHKIGELKGRRPFNSGIESASPVNHLALIGSPVSRRLVMKGLAALGATALLPMGRAIAQGTDPNIAGRRIIDVHHHMLPPKYLAAKGKLISPPGYNYVKSWTPQRSLEVMNKSGVSAAIMSQPGVWFGNVDEGRQLARMVSEYGAQLVKDYPGRFGFYASVPLPDIDGSLKQIEYGIDTLKADGICLVTSYDGKYLGDPSFAPVLDELNRRKAVVFVHPLAGNCCMHIQDAMPNAAFLEFPFDTTRTITDLIYTGTLARLPDIRFIFAHGGGTVPMLADRISLWEKVDPEVRKKVPKGTIYEMKRLHFETASTTNPPAFSALLKLMPQTQVVFGSDFPYGNPVETANQLEGLGLSSGVVHAIEHNNAAKMFPRFSTATITT